LVGADARSSSIQLSLEELSSVLLLNEGGQFKMKKLGSKAQYSSIHSILPMDHNGDGIMDLIIGGNDFRFKPQFGRQDASLGWVCYGKKLKEDFNFDSCTSLSIDGEIRALNLINDRQIIVGKNNGPIEIYERK